MAGDLPAPVRVSPLIKVSCFLLEKYQLTDLEKRFFS